MGAESGNGAGTRRPQALARAHTKDSMDLDNYFVGIPRVTLNGEFRTD